MASRGVQYQLDSVQYQPLTTCNTGENSTVPYVDSCNEISHHMINKNNKIQKHFQNVVLVGMASKSAKTTHTSVWITQDTTESRVPRLNVYTNQILAHTFSRGTLDSVLS